MVQVDFSDEERLRAGSVGQGSVGGLSGWFIRHKFAYDERQANQVLLLVFFWIVMITGILALIGLEVI
jgi:hypothetical protein